VITAARQIGAESERTRYRVAALCATAFPLMLLVGGIVTLVGSPMLDGGPITAEELGRWTLDHEPAIETGQLIVALSVFPMVGLFAILATSTGRALGWFGSMLGGVAAAITMVSAALRTEPASTLGFFENASDPGSALAFFTMSAGYHLDVMIDLLVAVGILATAVTLRASNVISMRMGTAIVSAASLTVILALVNIGRIGIVLTGLILAAALWQAPSRTDVSTGQKRLELG